MRLYYFLFDILSARQNGVVAWSLNLKVIKVTSINRDLKSLIKICSPKLFVSSPDICYLKQHCLNKHIFSHCTAPQLIKTNKQENGFVQGRTSCFCYSSQKQKKIKTSAQNHASCITFACGITHKDNHYL